MADQASSSASVTNPENWMDDIEEAILRSNRAPKITELGAVSN